MKTILKMREFRLLLSGQAVSSIGDQFNLIALPWLVLALTHDPLQLGGVLAAAGSPRALLMLVGGAWADRHSPRTIMLVSDALRFVLTAALAAAILAGTAQLWMVYVLAVAFGSVSGFFMPAAQATLPRVLAEEQLEAGNSLMMGANQAASFLGPVAAGVLIAMFGAGSSGSGQGEASLFGIGMAFAIDASSFLVSALMLLAMRRIASPSTEAATHPIAGILEGLRYSLGRVQLRAMFVIIACANFLIAGPMFVGMPVIAQTRLGGAAAFGAVMSSYAIGSLIGMVLAGALPRPNDGAFGWLVVGLLAGFGGSMAALGYLDALWAIAALMVATGIGNGYIGVHAISLLQRMAAEKYIGRVMSLLSLAMVGLMPMSQALSGLVIRVSPQALFVSAGVGFALLAAWSLARRDALALNEAMATPSQGLLEA